MFVDMEYVHKYINCFIDRCEMFVLKHPFCTEITSEQFITDSGYIYTIYRLLTLRPVKSVFISLTSWFICPTAWLSVPVNKTNKIAVTTWLDRL